MGNIISWPGWLFDTGSHATTKFFVRMIYSKIKDKFFLDYGIAEVKSRYYCQKIYKANPVCLGGGHSMSKAGWTRKIYETKSNWNMLEFYGTQWNFQMGSIWYCYQLNILSKSIEITSPMLIKLEWKRWRICAFKVFRKTNPRNIIDIIYSEINLPYE